jgi:phosphatidate cytidylyltransferase
LKKNDLVGRIVVGVPLAIAAVVLVAIGGWVFAAAVAALGCVCLHEFYDLMSARRPVRIAGFISLIAIALAAQLGGPETILVAAWLSLPLIFILTAAKPNLAGGTDTILSTSLGVWWIGIGFAHAILLRNLGHGGGVLIDALVGTFAGDTGAYFGGRSFGARALAPRISPRKTVEGLVAGMAAAVAAVFAASLYQDWMGAGEALLLGGTVAILAPVGDLFESLLKRDAGIKDSATTLGPHGGLLDRLDGVLFAVVGAYWIWRLVAG